ncbi:MAG: 16S rRNA (adenine(1518)-N(6)/adenine(1519)-N(6))-dimethyltransferase RsmA [Thermoanaerobacteraceae bacterium]|uniref:16S rRNA (adenine(1518)-N(6)/adenine(1519)-N(6))- dimethyltransferase RsmA n=1 Tax=Thermanaeromonas sp. C210 TaxID=2731925 RepID=UPI00155BEC56|nr:16S rRNA (adenine(1518)-N(6)/adenine(1519)-N(6))-dimethyltransferase RsmA [Thermanaeromonas sp. C210]MBE3580879.1 16S rRNA (adenine(1518)-N(6)/adenine(1519)-N(6))-dimethyltransferase RsmA [Thermoanaerobacteraceae bacterium]GFN21731.1 ribosomal RNA small subunit methyltransferase A [Thermanaeromonas sp. C210]
MHPVASPGRLISFMQGRGLSPRKSLGQNFLVDANIARKMAKEARLRPEDVVVEIGPGLGALTLELARRARMVVALEIDRGLVRALQEILVDRPNVRLVEGDALKADFDGLVAKALGLQDRGRLPAYKVVANLPYYITSPLLRRLLESGFHIGCMLLMLQAEVARRLVAPPGGKEYGALTVLVQYYARPEIVMQVPRTVFFPRPEVDSAVVRLDLHARPPVEVGDRDFFFRVVRAAFAQRRKTLANALRSLVGARGPVEEALAAAGINSSRRGETLSLEEFAYLSRCLQACVGRR